MAKEVSVRVQRACRKLVCRGAVAVGKYDLDLRLKVFEVTIETTPPFVKVHFKFT